MNKQEIEQTIANVEQQLASLKAELLKQDVSPTKWKRKGSWVLWADGDISTADTSIDCLHRLYDAQGRTYPTKEAAESVKPYDAFYGLLCGLACELNPSGKVGGEMGEKYQLIFEKETQEWTVYQWSHYLVTECLFETYDAANKAAEILNRDGIKPPQVGGVK